MLCLAMGSSAGQSQLLIPLSLLLFHVQPGTGLERISYVPRLSSAALAGKLTQSTFTLEQPLGHFNHLNISDFDPIWLVVALSNATQNFTAPQKTEDIPTPASFPQSGYYLTLRANRLRYPSRQTGSQLHILRVGNDTHCYPNSSDCNYPLPGPGPYRVKFLVMRSGGPVAETEWSDETRLPQAQALLAAPGPRIPGTVVIIAILSVLLAILLTALLILLIYTCFDSCRKTSMSHPGELVSVGRYNTHHMCSRPAMGSS